MILFVCATSQELQVIKDEIKKLKKNLEVDFLVLGIGNYETIFNLEKYFFTKKPDFIINVGVCGYKSEKIDLVQIGRIFNLSTNREALVPLVFEFTKIKSIACSEKIIYDLQEIGDENYVDMESFGVEFTSNKHKIPRLIIKVPIDRIGEETQKFDYKKALELLGKNINYKELIEKTEDFLSRNNSKKDYEFIKNHYKLTFSEFENLKKDIVKYEIIYKRDFMQFFEENQNLRKMEFLVKLTI